ncbi:MAG: Do family serine endopeptidase [Pseudobdellovibrionaceae bacterium]|nr:Do family serine endopeptidase [Bdellovibrionales bacterium]USN47521.1 MAG: Do family serine endopeptidase [Pseudobdellovibrionaceae bacterium]
MMLRSVFLFFVALVGFSFPNTSEAKLPKVEKGQPMPSDLFVELAKLVNPAVVNISTTQQVRMRRQFGPTGDPFFDLFQQFMGPQMQQPIQPAQSLGTGFIIREDGLILTNNHVIAQADIIQVQLSENDDQLYDAKVVGRDGRTDVALIKINAKKKLPVAILGTSSTLEVGEWVAAFGNPFGHGHTMTKGIISAKGREIDELNRFPFLQTDASINPGNSGGPLVNTAGEVIGVNTAVDARAQGIGFAIPIDDVKSILESLEKFGHIKRGYLGIYLTNVNPSSAQSLGLPSTKGALITQVEPGGPADKAGLKPYDFVLEVNGKEVKSSNDLVRSVMDIPVGGQAKMKINRNGKDQTLMIAVGSHPEDTKLADASPKRQEKTSASELGFKVADMSGSLIKEYNLPRLRKPRPVVVEVIAGSTAAQAGLAPGDVILDVNKKAVYSAKDVVRHFKKKQLNILRVLRQDQVFLAYLEYK